MIEEVPDIIDDIQETVTWADIGIGIGIFLVFLVFRKLFTNYVFKFILALSRKAPVDTLTNVLLAFERPLRSFFVFLGLFIAFVYFPMDGLYQETATRIFRTLVIFHAAWGLFNLSAATSAVFTQLGRKFSIEFDDILLPFVSKLVRFAIVVMALSIIASEWDYNVSGFVAGLGLGGLAFALAAQESLSNFFGGVVIITEKPFTLGDWIQTPSVEGFVEDISFRSTKVRTFADSVVIVPNSTLANEPIENWTKMEKRQISFNLALEYGTPRQKLQRCVEQLNAELTSDDRIDQDLIIVRFSEFNSSSLDIFLYFFTIPTGWVEYMKIKEEFNFRVLEILEEEGVNMAFPTQTIHLSKQERGGDADDLQSSEKPRAGAETR
ncbi:mechanosensitive ion channel family protein [Alkalicoccus chagannorensis]|uniref:mechanosensitive ion channel family protein n=1 Tax=Alkalicoccus chagannorensis TaxID=427072 RepID=UPI0003FC1678|nr:mechanosensitive ion channel family protein [Alkalicoccus chagannorensis]